MKTFEDLKILSDMIIFNNDYYYKNIYDIVIKEGIIFKSNELTKDELKIVNKAYKNMNFVPRLKNCFCNAQSLCINDFSNTIQYVEGYCKMSNIPISILHAWNSINGKLIDFTYKINLENNIDNEGLPILGKIPVDFNYIGISFNSDKIHEQIQSHECYTSLIDDPSENFKLLKYKL